MCRYLQQITGITSFMNCVKYNVSFMLHLLLQDYGCIRLGDWLLSAIKRRYVSPLLNSKQNNCIYYQHFSKIRSYSHFISSTFIRVHFVRLSNYVYIIVYKSIIHMIRNKHYQELYLFQECEVWSIMNMQMVVIFADSKMFTSNFHAKKKLIHNIQTQSKEKHFNVLNLDETDIHM